MTTETLNSLAPRPKHAFQKTCPTCGETFIPKNRKRIYCDDYCKNVWHYEKDKKENKNTRFLVAENKRNYKALKSFDDLGIYEVYERDLVLKGYNLKTAAIMIKISGQDAAAYNDLALIKNGDSYKIIKISEWK